MKGKLSYSIGEHLHHGMTHAQTCIVLFGLGIQPLAARHSRKPIHA